MNRVTEPSFESIIDFFYRRILFSIAEKQWLIDLEASSQVRVPLDVSSDKFWASD